MDIDAIFALSDNYIWAIRAAKGCILIDPGEAAPALRYLAERRLDLLAILVTHRHHDHIGGVAELAAHHPAPVFGPAEAGAVITHPVKEGDRIFDETPELTLVVFELPGHTRGHLAYYRPHVLFSGDVLFGAGCGKLFDGSFAEMFHSLARIAALPPETAIYCAHEYTQSCLPFAAAVEPENPAIAERRARVAALRAQKRPTVPLLLAEELATNPHLRWQAPEVREAARRWLGRAPRNDLETFTAIRQWRDAW